MKLIHIRSCTRRVFALNSKLCMKTVFFFKLLIGLKSSGCNWIYCRNTASRSARYRVRHPTTNSATAHPAANASGYLQRPTLFQSWATKRCYHHINIHHLLEFPKKHKIHITYLLSMVAASTNCHRESWHLQNKPIQSVFHIWMLNYAAQRIYRPAIPMRFCRILALVDRHDSWFVRVFFGL